MPHPHTPDVAEPAAEIMPLAPRTSSLGEVVRRRQHARTILQHPSQAPVPLHERVLRTAAAKRIVVVDDEADQVELTALLLESAGHTVHATTDGNSALGLVIDHLADLLLIDFMMPNVSGGEVGTALRAHPSAKLTKIVIISGTPEEVVRADFDQFEAFLQKPVHPDRLLRTVEDL